MKQRAKQRLRTWKERDNLHCNFVSGFCIENSAPFSRRHRLNIKLKTILVNYAVQLCREAYTGAWQRVFILFPSIDGWQGRHVESESAYLEI